MRTMGSRGEGGVRRGGAGGWGGGEESTEEVSPQEPQGAQMEPIMSSVSSGGGVCKGGGVVLSH